MKADQLKETTRRFSVQVLALSDKLPRTQKGKTVGTPLVRAGVAVGSAYRAACRARNHYAFMESLYAVGEALDDTLYWLEVCQESKIIKDEVANPIIEEARKLAAIIKKSHRSASKRLRQSRADGRVEDGDIPF
ncbi:MAG: four helix bundle protein [Phycisphaera sp.]|nr:four helix bundle protein [Phycisphaera sp.]